VAPGEVSPRLGHADAVYGRDPVRSPLVVLDVGVERLLRAKPLDVFLQLRPAGEPMLARELVLRVAEA
jgi:hypothetical protein